jgi:nucleoside-diphosphate-sugar epimerase
VTTLVTGATGHLGTNLVRLLLERQEAVRVLLRPNSDNAHIEALPVERAYGDVTDRGALEGAVRGCRRVYHLASVIRIVSGGEAGLFEVNVLGARGLFQAALKAGVERVVHCSSFGAVGTNPDGPSDEEWIASPFEGLSGYHMTKIFAEHEALRAVARGLHVTIVNPSALVGPWDYRPSLLGQTILDFCRGRLRAYVPGAFVYVPVRDAAQGMLLAMEKGRAGERYLLTGEVVTIDEILMWLSEFTGVARPRIRIPFGVMSRVARVKDRVQGAFFPRAVPRFTYHSIRTLNSGKTADNSKARQELGFRPTSVKEAFREAVEWFYSHGYVSRTEG